MNSILWKGKLLICGYDSTPLTMPLTLGEVEGKIKKSNIIFPTGVTR
jgi:hypothetical protein